MTIQGILVILFICHGLVGRVLYLLMYKKRKLFTDRYGMIMAMCSSGIVSMNLAMLLQFLFPANPAHLAILSTSLGGAIGIVFGSLVKFQSLLAGFSQGALSGMMGSMLGAVVKNPSLCNLPASYLNSVDQTMMAFSLFGTLLLFTTAGMLYYSMRV